MGQYISSLDAILKNQDEEVVVDRPVVPEPSTPNGRNTASFDPRSPTDGMVRTPLSFTAATSAPAMTAFDPRSPTIGVERTPVLPSTGCERDELVDEVSCRLSELDGSFSANDSMVAVCGSLENLSTDVKDLTLDDISEDVLDSSYEESEENLTDEDGLFASLTEGSAPAEPEQSETTSPSTNVSWNNISIHEDATASPKAEVESTPRIKPLTSISVNSPHRLVQRKQVANVNQKIVKQISALPRKTNHCGMKSGQSQLVDKENAVAI